MPSLSAAGSHDCLRVLAIDYERNPMGPVHLAWAVLTPGPGFFGPLRSPSFRRWHKSKFMALLREQSQHIFSLGAPYPAISITRGQPSNRGNILKPQTLNIGID